MNPEFINTSVGIRSVAVIDLLHGQLTSAEDAKTLLDYAKHHDCNFLDFEDVAFIGIPFIAKIIEINNDIILVEADHLIPEVYHERLNLLKARRFTNPLRFYNQSFISYDVKH